mmetsp:Transcript_79294/g.201831  ORF Transcript_79294/g.201831 Transcript_79294/m.201831 type:complete len:207 (+) Transcript_79294:11-631(+)
MQLRSNVRRRTRHLRAPPRRRRPRSLALHHALAVQIRSRRILRIAASGAGSHSKFEVRCGVEEERQRHPFVRPLIQDVVPGGEEGIIRDLTQDLARVHQKGTRLSRHSNPSLCPCRPHHQPRLLFRPVQHREERRVDMGGDAVLPLLVLGDSRELGHAQAPQRRLESSAEIVGILAQGHSISREHPRGQGLHRGSILLDSLPKVLA